MTWGGQGLCVCVHSFVRGNKDEGVMSLVLDSGFWGVTLRY